MYFAAGSIADLIAWFNSAAARERMLCLIAPRDPDDEKLVGELFNARGSLSPRLSDNVALCLFSDNATLLELRARSPQPSEAIIIPGLVQTRNMPHELRNLQRVGPVLAERVPGSVREEVLLRTTSIAGELSSTLTSSPSTGRQ
jgi:hypothetical protein